MDKRIIFFVSTMADGGAQRVISILTKELSQINYLVEILTYFDEKPVYEIPDHVKLTCVCKETASNNLCKNLLWMRKYFSQNAQKVVSFLAPFNMMAVISCVGTQIPLIVADRNDPRMIPGNKVLRFFRDFLYNFAEHIVVQTTHNKEYFSKSIQAKTTVIFNPVNLGANAGLALRTPKKKKIVSVARLIPQKNQRMLLSAFAEISRDHPEYELVIYGQGPEKENLLDLAKRLEIDKKVHFPGNVTDVFERIADAEIFVLTSNFEGMPNALIEAMCVGLPCITTRVSGTEDLIENGKNGEIIEIGKTSELVMAMRKLIESKEIRDLYARNGLYLNQKLGKDVIVKQWICCIGEIK